MRRVNRTLLKGPTGSVGVAGDEGEGEEFCSVLLSAPIVFDPDDGKRNALHVGCTPVAGVSVLAPSLEVPGLLVDWCFVV